MAEIASGLAREHFFDVLWELTHVWLDVCASRIGWRKALPLNTLCNHRFGMDCLWEEGNLKEHHFALKWVPLISGWIPWYPPMMWPFMVSKNKELVIDPRICLPSHDFMCIKSHENMKYQDLLPNPVSLMITSYSIPLNVPSISHSQAAALLTSILLCLPELWEELAQDGHENGGRGGNGSIPINT